VVISGINSCIASGTTTIWIDYVCLGMARVMSLCTVCLRMI
jgi:hypothetical protein